MRWIRDVAAILRDPLTLGLCCLVLAGIALLQRDQINNLSTVQRCRDELHADLVIEAARSLQRIETAQHERAVGDWVAASLAQPQDELDAYERAITRRENAVSICGGG